MPCDSRPFRPRQTLAERKEEVRSVVQKLEALLASKQVTAKVGPQGAIAFAGWSETDRAGITDACVYRRIMASGSATSRQAIARAEALAGRTVNKATVATGTHSHDGGKSWHHGH
jgi:hypothetical protein